MRSMSANSECRHRLTSITYCTPHLPIIGEELTRSVLTRKRQPSNHSATPPRMLEGRAFAPALRAPGGLAQYIAGRIRAPTDDKRSERHRWPWRHCEFAQWTHSHGADRRICSSVGGVVVWRFIGAP